MVFIDHDGVETDLFKEVVLDHSLAVEAAGSSWSKFLFENSTIVSPALPRRMVVGCESLRPLARVANRLLKNARSIDLPRLGAESRSACPGSHRRAGEDRGSFEVDLVSDIGKKDGGSVGRVCQSSRLCADDPSSSPQTTRVGMSAKASNGGNARLCRRASTQSGSPSRADRSIRRSRSTSGSSPNRSV